MLQTDRCRIRTFEEKDLDIFMSYRNNEEWMKYQSFKNLTKAEYRAALLGDLHIEDGIQLAVTDSITDTLLGDLYLSKKENTVTIGYSIHPIHARKGYIFEVLKAGLPELQSYFSDCEIVALTDKANIPSKNLLLKLGFVFDEWIEEWESEVYVYQNKTGQ